VWTHSMFPAQAIFIERIHNPGSASRHGYPL
jgi:hypothetical protein